MRIEKTQVFGFESSIRAMRNPMDSWNLSDSSIRDFPIKGILNDNIEGFILGDKDKKLSQNLSKAGTDHRKHLRLIRVWADFALPRYVWTETDTYKYIDKVSCSTMHTLMRKPVSQDNFESDVPNVLLKILNNYIDEYKKADKAKDIEEKNVYKIRCKNDLPEGFLQLRTICTNYECLLAIYNSRKNHPLPQWKEICKWILELPYFIELTGIEV